MAIERLTPQDGEWTGHSLQAHQYSCICLQQAAHQYRPCNVTDIYDPCRTGNMRKPVPEIGPVVQQPWDGDISPRRREREREERERKNHEQRTEKATQSTYDTLINRQRSPELNSSTPTFQASKTLTNQEVVSQASKETSRTAKESFSEARTIASSIYREERDIEHHLEQELHLKPHSAIQRTVDDYKTAITAPQKTIVGSAICGAASLVAAVAVCNLTAYKADLDDLEAKSLAKRIAKEERRETAATVIHTVTSFKDYANSVIDAKAYERTAIQEARVEREQQKAEISNKREQIEQKYQNQTAEIGRRRDVETAEYTHQMQKLDGDISRIYNSSRVQEYNRERQEKIQNATTTFEHNKAVINENRALALDRIDRSTPIAAAQIREVNRQYDTKISTLESNHSKNISRIHSTYDDRVKVLTNQADKKVADIVAQKTALTQQHEKAQKEFKSQLAGAKRERDSAIQTTRHEVAKIKGEYKSAKDTIQKTARDRSTEVKTIFNGNWVEMKENKANRAIAKSAKHGDSAFELKQILVTKQFALAQYMINSTGTEQEKQLLAAFLQDKKNEQQSRDTGIPLANTMRKLSADDTKAAEALMAKFGASNLSSIKGNADIVKFLEAKIPELQALAIQKNEAWSNAKLAVDQLKADKKALLAKAGGKADNLSAPDKKKLEQIKTSLAKAISEEKIAKKNAQESKSMVNAAKQNKKDIKKHSELLAKLGDKSKPKKRPNNSLYKQASKNLTRSLTMSLAALNRLAQQNNAILSADHQFQASMRKLADYTDFAAKTIQRTATVGKMATKMVLGVGKLGGKALILIASRSKSFQASRDRLLRFAANNPRLMKALNKTGNLVGKGLKLGGKAVTGAMFLPGQLIRLSSMSVLDMPAMIEQKLLSWTVKGGVALTKLGGRIVVRGAAVATKPLVKLGARAGRAVGNGVKTVVGGTAKLVGKGIGGAVRLVGKGVGGAGKMAGRGVATLARRTIGRSPVWAKLKQMGGAVGGFFKKIGGALLTVFKFITDPLAALRAVAMKILSFLFSAIAAIAGAIMSLISWAVGKILLIAFGGMFWLLIAILLLSVLDAIYEFFMQFTTERRILISEDPSYIMNLGANYRNVELSIVEFFTAGDGMTNNAGYDGGIECNDDPIYYAIFNNSFNWFGRVDNVIVNNSCKDINYKVTNGVMSRHYNKAAADAYEQHMQSLKAKQDSGLLKNLSVESPGFLETIRAALAALCNMAASFFENLQSVIGVALARDQGTFGNSFWETLPKATVQVTEAFKQGRFRTQVTTYDKVEVSYYEGTKASHGAKSTFEISNAKDAMAMMDAIYTMDSDMTRIKALRYLGVGEFQLSCHDDAVTSTKDADNLDNLFWKTHQIDYSDGVKANQIVFHPQNTHYINKIGTNSEPGVAQNPNDPYYGILNVQCDHYSTITYKYQAQDHVDGTCGKWVTPTQKKYEGSNPNWTDPPRHSVGYVSFPERYETTQRVYDNEGNYYTVVTQTRVYCGTDHGNGYHCSWTIDGKVSSNFSIYYGAYSSGTRYIEYYYTLPKYWQRTNKCEHLHEPVEETFDFCMGHARLAANIYVAIGKNTSGLPSIYDQAAQMTAKNYQIGNAIFTWSKDLDVRGWGPAPEEYIDPPEEWSDSGLVSLAQGKCEEPLEYQGEADDITQLKTKHGKATGPQYLVTHEAGSDLLYHILYFKENVFYASDLMAGKQEDIEVKKDPGDINSRVGVSVGLNTVKMSIKQAADGIFYVSVSSY